MEIPNQYVALVIAALSGVVLGLIGGPVFILIPWGLVGLAIGFISSQKRTAMLNGSVFGFMACYFFMVSGYRGVSPLATRLVPFIIIGLIGAVCGLILGLMGSLLHKRKH